jgi:hypothetical protein
MDVSEEDIAIIFRVEEIAKKNPVACRLLIVGFLLSLLFNPEDGRDEFPRTLPECTALQPISS